MCAGPGPWILTSALLSYYCYVLLLDNICVNCYNCYYTYYYYYYYFYCYYLDETRATNRRPGHCPGPALWIFRRVF